MIFPFYRQARLTYDHKISDYTVPMDHSMIQATTEIHNLSPSKTQTSASETLQWLKRKSNKYQQIQKFNLQNSSRRTNFCQLPLAKFFIKRKNFIDSAQPQQTADFSKQRQKRFHSQSQYLENRKKSFYFDKNFNQTFIDSQHNFIGKNYQKQVQNIKLNSPNLPESRLKLFLSTTVESKSTKNQKLNSFTFQKICKPQQKGQNLFVKKRLSLGDKFEIQKSKKFGQQTSSAQSKKQSINVQLRRQIQKSVKDDIKAQIIKFKKSKFNKFKFKENKLKSQKKNLEIQKHQNHLQKIQEKPESISEHTSKFLTQYNCEVKFNGKKRVQVIKKSHSSFNNYGSDQIKVEDKIKVVPIFQDLDPWQGQSTQFYGFR